MSDPTVSFTLKLAEIPIKANVKYERTKEFCRDYLCDEAPIINVTVTDADIAEMREASVKTDIAEGRRPIKYNDEYLEQLALYRVILDELIHYNVLLVHGSVIALDGKAYMFTAKSGVGKTTHSRLWLKNIKNSYILNGDKPLILFKSDGIYACGTPWQGKEKYGVNEILPLEAICLIERSTENRIEAIPFSDAFKTLTKQSHHPKGNEALIKSLKLIGGFNNLRLFRLYCNTDDEAATVAYNGMVHKK